MSKLRKMLGKADSPYIIALMRAIETQSKATLVKWTLNTTQKYIMPIYLSSVDIDLATPTIKGAEDWMEGKIKFADAKAKILALHEQARSLENNPIAQAGARAIGQACSAIHAPTHSLGVAFYGSACVAYSALGLDENQSEYDKIASEFCAKLLEDLQAVSIVDEPNKAKINWRC